MEPRWVSREARLAFSSALLCQSVTRLSLLGRETESTKGFWTVVDTPGNLSSWGQTSYLEAPLASLLELRRPSFHSRSQYPKASLVFLLLWHWPGIPERNNSPARALLFPVAAASPPVSSFPSLVCKLLGITTFQPLIKVPVVQGKQISKPLFLTCGEKWGK